MIHSPTGTVVVWSALQVVVPRLTADDTSTARIADHTSPAARDCHYRLDRCSSSITDVTPKFVQGLAETRRLGWKSTPPLILLDLNHRR